MDEQSSSCNFHYEYIKNYYRLTSSQTNLHGHKVYNCPHCQRGFGSEELLNSHLDLGCLAVEGQSISLPKKGSTIQFENFNNKFKAPYVIYGDFESLNTKRETWSCKLSKEVKPEDKTKPYQKHIPCGYKILVVGDKKNVIAEHLYRGEDCMEMFVLKLNEFQQMIIDKLKVNVDINMTIQDNEAFKNAYKCYICDNVKGGFDYTSKCLCKVRDHDHSNGKYLGAAHSECNLKRNNKNVKIPVFFHNLKGYDAHHIISNAHLLGKKKY